MQKTSKRRHWLVPLVITMVICLASNLASCVLLYSSPPPTTPTINAMQFATPTAKPFTPTPFDAHTPISISITSTSWPLPQFPWPPPEPSAKAVLSLGLLAKLAGNGLTFQDVNQRISNALDLAGYDETSYFAVPNGFAIVTRLEMMDANGYPEYASRWASSLKPISFTEFSLTKYMQALFSAPQGHYRVFVFMMTSDLVVQSGTAVAQGTAQTWIVQGADRLPSGMKDIPYTRDYTATVYVYEFNQSGVNADANQNIPSRLTGRQHLEEAGLWENLNITSTLTPTATVTPMVELINIYYWGPGVGCQAWITIRVIGAPVTGNIHVRNAYNGQSSDVYSPITLNVGDTQYLVALGGRKPQYYLHEAWFEYNGRSSNHLTNLICPGLTPAP